MTHKDTKMIFAPRTSKMKLLYSQQSIGCDSQHRSTPVFDKSYQ